MQLSYAAYSAVLQVYYDPSCKYKPSELDHSVMLMGFGTDEKAGDYWLIRNSWQVASLAGPCTMCLLLSREVRAGGDACIRPPSFLSCLCQCLLLRRSSHWGDQGYIAISR